MLVSYLLSLTGLAHAIQLGIRTTGDIGDAATPKLFGTNPLGCAYYDSNREGVTPNLENRVAVWAEESDVISAEPDDAAWALSGIVPLQVYSQDREKNDGDDPRSPMTLEVCRDFCFPDSHFFIMFRGNDCACFDYDFKGVTAPNDKCRLPCAGDKSQMCGGTDAGNVFKLVNEVPPVDTATCPSDVAEAENEWKRDDNRGVMVLLHASATKGDYVVPEGRRAASWRLRSRNPKDMAKFRKMADLFKRGVKVAKAAVLTGSKIKDDVIQDSYAVPTFDEAKRAGPWRRQSFAKGSATIASRRRGSYGISSWNAQAQSYTYVINNNNRPPRMYTWQNAVLPVENGEWATKKGRSAASFAGVRGSTAVTNEAVGKWKKLEAGTGFMANVRSYASYGTAERSEVVMILEKFMGKGKEPKIVDAAWLRFWNTGSSGYHYDKNYEKNKRRTYVNTTSKSSHIQVANKEAGTYRALFVSGCYGTVGAFGPWWYTARRANKKFGRCHLHFYVYDFVVKPKSCPISYGSSMLPTVKNISGYCTCGRGGAVCGSTPERKAACVKCGDEEVCLVKNKKK